MSGKHRFGGARAGVLCQPADNTRVGEQGAMSGWDQMRARITGVDDVPMLYVFSTCRDFIRTVPVLQHDRDRPEDLDTDAEDHIADETRYACSRRIWLPRKMTAREKSREATRRWRLIWGGGDAGLNWKTM